MFSFDDRTVSVFDVDRRIGEHPGGLKHREVESQIESVRCSLTRQPIQSTDAAARLLRQNQAMLEKIAPITAAAVPATSCAIGHIDAPPP